MEKNQFTCIKWLKILKIKPKNFFFTSEIIYIFELNVFSIGWKKFFFDETEWNRINIVILNDYSSNDHLFVWIENLAPMRKSKQQNFCVLCESYILNVISIVWKKYFLDISKHFNLIPTNKIVLVYWKLKFILIK